MRILVTENQFKKILRTDDVLLATIKEQLQALNTMPANPTVPVIQSGQNAAPSNDDSAQLISVQNEINKLIGDKQDTILNGAKIWIEGNDQQYVLHIGDSKMDLKPALNTPNAFNTVLRSGSKMTFGGIDMKEFIPQIEENKNYQLLSQKHPEIKAQVQAGPSAMLYVKEGEQGYFVYTKTTTPPAMNVDPEGKEMPENAYPFGTHYPLGDFFARNKMYYKIGKTPRGKDRNGNRISSHTVYGLLESGQISMQLLPIELKPEEKAPAIQGPTTTIPIVPLRLIDSFNFDDITFADEGKTNQEINAFVKDMKNKISQYGVTFTKWVISQEPTIIGFSSIDGDPNQAIVGKYQPCSGSKTRFEYDKCLSGERAKSIATILNKELPDLGNAIQSDAGGETDQGQKLAGNPNGKVGVKWTPQHPTVPTDTKDNRIFFFKFKKPGTPFMAPQAPQAQVVK
jgi:hypothetical protein